MTRTSSIATLRTSAGGSQAAPIPLRARIRPGLTLRRLRLWSGPGVQPRLRLA